MPRKDKDEKIDDDAGINNVPDVYFDAHYDDEDDRPPKLSRNSLLSRWLVDAGINKIRQSARDDD